jgi:DNA-binding NarL/FixJ family response regulator
VTDRATIRVLIVDDQAMVREGFGALLAAQPDLAVVGTAGDGAAGVDMARRLRPDVVLMDVRLVGSGPKVLILTTFDLDDYVYEALRAGASGFLLKDAPAADLVAAVRVIAAGEALLAPSVTRRLIAEFASRPRPANARPVSLGTLTPRETEVLRLIARGRSNTEIAADLVVAEQTVKTHVGRILAKLDLRDRAQAVVVYTRSNLAPCWTRCGG